MLLYTILHMAKTLCLKWINYIVDERWFPTAPYLWISILVACMHECIDVCIYVYMFIRHIPEMVERWIILCTVNMVEIPLSLFRCIHYHYISPIFEHIAYCLIFSKCWFPTQTLANTMQLQSKALMTSSLLRLTIWWIISRTHTSFLYLLLFPLMQILCSICSVVYGYP